MDTHSTSMPPIHSTPTPILLRTRTLRSTSAGPASVSSSAPGYSLRFADAHNRFADVRARRDDAGTSSITGYADHRSGRGRHLLRWA